MEGTQLTLLTERDWRLDDRTRAIGRRGIAEARAVLRSSARSGHTAPTDPSQRRAA